MKMRNILLLVASAFLLVMSACTKKQNANERVLNLVSITEIKGYDPIMANDLYSGREISKIYEGLLAYHWLKIPYELVPNLAAAMPEASKDGLTYTFKIRPGVKFQDDAAFPGGKGRDITAADFVYSIKRLADSKNNSDGWWVMDGKVVGLNEWRDKYSKLPTTDYNEEIEGVKALDNLTLQFKLKKAFPQFLYGLSMPYTFVVAKEVVEKYGKEFLNHPVGTGPFYLTKFDQGKMITYYKNPTFREKFYPSDASPEFQHLLGPKGKRLPLVDKIVVNVIIESQPAWLKLNKGEVDSYSIPKDNFASAVQNNQLSPELKAKGFDLLIAPMLDLTYTAFNYDMKIFQNVKLRRAMFLAFDEAKSNTLFYNDTAFPAQGLLPPGISGNIKGYTNPYKGPNIEAAKKMLAEAGYPDGKGLPEITYDFADSTTSRQMGEFFQKQMAQIGVKIKLQSSPWPEFLAKQKKRALQIFGAAWGADYPDAENFFQLLYGPNASPGSNSSNYNDAQFNKDYETAVIMQDSPARTALYEKLNKKIAEDVILMYNNHRQAYSISQGWLMNYHYPDLNLDYAEYLDIDNAKKAELLKKF